MRSQLLKCQLVLLAWVASGLAQAQIRGVEGSPRTARILGVTAQQAILTYSVASGQEDQPCVIEVSPSATYTPPVPDVNPLLFAGANLDSRRGVASNGRVRTLTIGKRTVETASDGNTYSRSLAASTTYYYRITCPSSGGGAVSTGAFATGLAPSGLGYGDPIPTDPDHPGKYLYPTMSATDRTATTVDPHTGTLLKNLVLPGDMSGNGVNPNMGAAGNTPLCHPVPVKASDEDKYGYHCTIMLSSGAPGLYWIADDGEARFLGVMGANYLSGYHSSGFYALIPNDIASQSPNDFWIVYAHDVGNYLLKATYNGHDTPGADTDLTGQPQTNNNGMPHTVYTIFTPETGAGGPMSRNFQQLLSEFDPTNWTSYIKPLGRYLYNPAFISQGKLVLTFWNGQDQPGWVAIFDLKATAASQTAKFGSAAGCIDNPAATGSSYAGYPGCIIGDMGTLMGAPGSPYRYATLHNVGGGSDLRPGRVGVSFNPLRLENQPWYQVTVPNGLPASHTSCTMPKTAGASYINDWPDSSYAPGCITVTVAGEPSITTPTTGYPSMTAAPGDVLTVNSASAGNREVLRLLDKGGDGKTWYLQRQYTAYGGGTASYDTVAANGALDIMGPNWHLANSWDYVNGPMGTDDTNTYVSSLPDSHTAVGTNYSLGISLTVAAYGSPTPGFVWQQCEYPACSALSPPRYMRAPGFNGVACAPNSTGPCAVESHLSISATAAPNIDIFSQFLDNFPYFGDSGLVQPANVRQVAGQLYVIRGTNILNSYKQIAYFANSGSNSMREVSGPSAAIATDSSTAYQHSCPK